MAPKTRAKSAKAGAKDLILKQTINSKLYINTRKNDSKDTKQCGHRGASVRSENTETALQDTANVSDESLDFIQQAKPQESAGVPSAAVLLEWNGKRRRTACSGKTACSEEYFYQHTYSRRQLVAATTLMQMKKDPNYSAPV